MFDFGCVQLCDMSILNFINKQHECMDESMFHSTATSRNVCCIPSSLIRLEGFRFQSLPSKVYGMIFSTFLRLASVWDYQEYSFRRRNNIGEKSSGGGTIGTVNRFRRIWKDYDYFSDVIHEITNPSVHLSLDQRDSSQWIRYCWANIALINQYASIDSTME